MSNKEVIVDYLFGKYDKSTLTRVQVAVELDISLSSLEKRIKENNNIPSYKRIGNRLSFPVTSVADYLVNDLIESV